MFHLPAIATSAMPGFRTCPMTAAARQRCRAGLLRKMISRQQGPMFPGNQIAQEARDSS